MPGSTLTLSTVNPDFEGTLAELQTYAATLDALKGFLPTQTGQTLLDMIAAVNAARQLKLQRYHEDSFPYTAQNDDAIYAITHMQGVRLNRKLPASCSVQLASPVPVTVPRFTKFTISGVTLYNRSAYSLSSTPITAVLYEGTLVDISQAGLGTVNSMFASREAGFAVSDVDVEVYVNGVLIQRVTDGLWNLKGKGGYRDATLPDGRMLVEFGTLLYGTMPSTADTVRIVYAVTKGSAGSGIKTADKKITCDDYPTVVGVGVNDLSGGADETPALAYKNIGGAAFGTFGSAVIPSQYKSTILSYPGVIDAKTFAQRERNPAALTLMNVIQVVLLTNTPWNATQLATFDAWLQERTMYAPRFQYLTPQPVNTNVVATVYCYNWAIPSQCAADARVALENLFAPRQGILGYDLHMSDLDIAVKNSNKGIEYVDFTSPTSSLIVSDQPMAAPTAAVASGGLLAAGTYHYAVSPVLPTGQLSPRNWNTVTVGASSTVNLSWPAYPGATSYVVWGRSSNFLGQIAAGLVSPVFSDNGSIVVTPGTPPGNTVVPRYNASTSIVVTGKYSTRNL